jgi:superfamily I DNA and/or RNA helicase
LAHFLCEQGVQQEKITVLVTYAAQMRAMVAHRREQYKLRSLDRVHITTVDNYQGEENDIIILSLVRNNRIKSVGFLRTSLRRSIPRPSRTLSLGQHPSLGRLRE